MTEKTGQNKKLGMVFEGGANRTIFSCGVMDALLEADIMPDYMIGVSRRDRIWRILSFQTKGQKLGSHGEIHGG